MLRPRTIRMKLLLYAGAVLVVPTIVYGFLTYAVARRALQPSLEEELADDASTVKIATQELLAAHIQNVATWARLDFMREMVVHDVDKTISHFLERVKRDYGVYLDLMALDEAGICRASSSPVQIGTRPRLPAIRFAGSPAVGVPTVGFSDTHARYYIALAAPIFDPEHPQVRLGRLVALLDLGSLRDVVRAKAGHHTVKLSLVDAAGRVLAGPSRQISEGSQLPSWNLTAVHPPRYQTGHRPVLYKAIAPDGSEFQVAEAGLDAYRALPDLDWSVLATIPTDVALAPVRHVRDRVLLFGSAVTLAGLALAWLIAINIARPINRLTRIATRIAEHGTLEPIPDPTSADEVGALTRAFQTMVENISAAHEELVQSAKLAFLGELSAGIAHEIRTPLGIIKNSAQLLERRVAARGDQEGVEFARFIQEESDRLNGVVTSLLDFARPAPLETAATDLNEVVQRAVEFLSAQAASRRVELVCQPTAGLPEVECDARQVYQVLLNLILNAIQACSEGDRVEVQTRTAGSGVELVVRDTGPGIPPEIRDRLFAPFATKREGGIGLGLAIVQRIVTAHRGRVEARNREGGGAEFRVWLPADTTKRERIGA
ncbi:MAG: HAMP domain-containing protein [Candidatus Dadabacteria bacterium]|nr:MAG: HAMP domain-containing protein [Candidatus Dadabacteria bacterium]